jgi:hypothetical protein
MGARETEVGLDIGKRKRSGIRQGWEVADKE